MARVRYPDPYFALNEPSGARWKSNTELKIDKNGYVILNGQKTKTFWDGKILSGKKPLRMKIRNIAGDETIVPLS